jgi:hypothetical protein
MLLFLFLTAIPWLLMGDSWFSWLLRSLHVRPNIIADHITMVVDSLLNKILLCTRVGLVPEGSGNPFFWPHVFVWSSSFSEDQWHSLDLLRCNMSLLFGQANTSWHVMLLLFVLSVCIMGCGCCFFIAVVCALSVCRKYLWKRIACFLREILTLQSNGWAHKLRFGP